MTGDVAAAAGGCHLFSGCGFPAPGLQDFDFQTLFTIGAWHVTKPEVLAILAALVVIVFFWVAFRKPTMIPGKTQSIGELAILAVRDQIIRPQLGAKGDKYLAYISAMFFWILVCNLMELIPILQFPVMARIGFVLPMVADHVRHVLVHGASRPRGSSATSGPGSRRCRCSCCRC